MPILKFKSPETVIINEEVAFNDLLFISPELLIEDVGFGDSVSEGFTVSLSLIDSVGFGDTLSSTASINETINSQVIFKDFLGSKDILITWNGVTTTARYGYGGTAYGDVLGYGESFSSELDKFIIVVKNVIDTTLRMEELTFDTTDPIISPNKYWYDLTKNLADNTTINYSLTFDVYQKNKLGLLSEVRTVNHLETPVITNGLISYYSCDSVIGTTLYDDYGDNHLTLISNVAQTTGIKYNGITFSSPGGTLGNLSSIFTSFDFTSGFTFITFAKLPITIPASFRFFYILDYTSHNHIEFGNTGTITNIYIRIEAGSLAVTNGIKANETHMYAWTINPSNWYSTVYRDKNILINQYIASVVNINRQGTIGTYTGIQDEIYFYNRCLTSEEIYYIFDCNKFHIGG